MLERIAKLQSSRRSHSSVIKLGGKWKVCFEKPTCLNVRLRTRRRKQNSSSEALEMRAAECCLVALLASVKRHGSFGVDLRRFLSHFDFLDKHVKHPSFAGGYNPVTFRSAKQLYNSCHWEDVTPSKVTLPVDFLVLCEPISTTAILSLFLVSHPLWEKLRAWRCFRSNPQKEWQGCQQFNSVGFVNAPEKATERERRQ